MRWALACALLFVAVPVTAQESRFVSDLRREGQDIKESCTEGVSPKQLIACVVTIATDDPLHPAFGSLAPGNGVAFGLAFAEHTTPKQWRISWNADAVAAPSGSWRAGAYAKFVKVPQRRIGITRPAPGGDVAPSTTVSTTESPIFSLFTQTISLDELKVAADQATFREKQTIVGGDVVYPVSFAPTRGLRPSVLAGVNGRFLRVQSTPSAVESEPSFAEFSEGVRVRPSLAGDHIQLNYLASVQEFAASGAESFVRWTLDLQHAFPLYGTVASIGRNEKNGPNDCFDAVGSTKCAPVSYSRNLEGAVRLRVLSIRSSDATPFYFQPTLGGSDINGERLLSAFDDYRFRGTRLTALQESIEHSVWGPVGVYALIEQGQLTGAGPALSDGWKASYAVGVTLRAGGFPLVNLTFAWGADGHHVIGTIDPSLLGGGGRPSLF